MNPNASWLRLSPPQIFVAGFAIIILIGSLLLMLPISNTTGKPLAFIDALFTAASATCVTGLVVKDTGTFLQPLVKLLSLRSFRSAAWAL